MNPLELIGWALAAAVAILILGIAFGMAAAITRGLMNRSDKL